MQHKFLGPRQDIERAKWDRFKANPHGRVVALDLDNTLYPTGDLARLARLNAIRAMINLGIGASEDFLLERLSAIITEFGPNASGHFDVICEEMQLGAYTPMFVAAAVKAYHETKTSMQPYSEVPAVLSLLSEQGHLLVVVTEGIPVKQWDKLLRLGVHHFFWRVYVAKEKTANLYSQVLSDTGIRSKLAISVGDSPEKDILPAAELKMRTFRVLRGRFSGIPCPEANWTEQDLSSLPLIVSGL